LIKTRVIVPAIFLFLMFSCFGCLENIEPVSTAKEEYASAPSPDGSDTPGSPVAPEGQSAETSQIAAGQKAGSPARAVIRSKAGKNADTGSKDESEKTLTGAAPANKTQLVLDEALDFCQAAQDFWQKGELESAIESLDQAYSLILSIDDKDTEPDLLQQKEDLRFTISKRILEIYASRNIAVNGGHNEIPLVLNNHVMAEVRLFTEGKEKEFFRESYRRSGLYRTEILAALKEAGLPAELSWLPLIESGFKVNALSSARALGLWQFIPSTGYKFGLKRNYYMDERLDPVKATRAAIDYLKELHSLFGDWTTVLAAYNCGEGKVLRMIREQNINYLDDFWDLYERLPRETARYVPRFLATLHVLQNREKYGIDGITPDPPLVYETVEISRSVHLRDVSGMIGVPEATLKALNPELRYTITPPESYALRIPEGKKNTLLAKLDDIPVTSKPRLVSIQHRVRRGETLSTIARKYGTSINAIIQANTISRKNYIVAGQLINIPQKGTVVYKTQKYEKTEPAKPATHTVKSGDSLWIIAKKYGITVKQIQKENDLDSIRLQVGQVLKIPGPGIVAQTEETLKTYRVIAGDSPFRIAQRHDMALERFLRINRMTPRSRIYPGQMLLIE